MEETRVDPLTHVVIGLGTAGLSGQPIALNNPIYIGAVLGAVVPDLDVITHFSSSFSFLKHHRGVSHSLVGILGISLIITALLAFFFPGGYYLSYFAWTFLGALSHSITDSLNSYGIQFWWPFQNTRWTANLLVLFDHWLILFYLLLLFSWQMPLMTSRLVLVIITIYLVFRYRMRIKMEKYLAKYFRLKGEDRAVVMPAQFGFSNWEFVVENKKEFILGKIKYFGFKVSTEIKLAKASKNPFIDGALNSKVGKFFRIFTPFMHLEYKKEKGRHVVFFRDLRYMIKKTGFLHTATVIVSDELKVMSSYLHTFNNDSIVPEKESSKSLPG